MSDAKSMLTARMPTALPWSRTLFRFRRF